MRRKKLKPLRYFFYHDELHKKIHIDRGNDIIVAWNYPQHKPVRHVYSDVRKNGERAWRTVEVSQMVRRKPDVIKRMIIAGMFEPPTKTYGLTEERPDDYAYYWSEKDIMNLHDYLKTVHIGRPRADGMINTRDLPTATELRATIRQGTVLYVKSDDGEFVPTWQAERL